MGLSRVQVQAFGPLRLCGSCFCAVAVDRPCSCVVVKTALVHGVVALVYARDSLTCTDPWRSLGRRGERTFFSYGIQCHGGGEAGSRGL